MTLPRIGLDLLDKSNAAAAVSGSKRAEGAGVPMIWSTTGRGAPDPLSFFAAVAVETKTLGFGTAITPTYPRHPAVTATQALALDQLAPGRFRLGVGPSHGPVMRGALGLEMGRPLEHLREYVQVLRGLLWEGRVDFEGHYYNVHSDLSATAQVPIYISALRTGAFRLAGEVADGAISWLCPLGYLRVQAAVALRTGAAAVGRPPARLIAHVPVVATTDKQTMLAVARPRISGYGRLPFYAAMFADAGYPVGPNGEVSDDLLDHLVVWGDADQIRARLDSSLGNGIDELLVTLIPGQQPADELAAVERVVATIAASEQAR